MTALDSIRDVIQEDVNQRGLRTDPDDNLITACPDDFPGACASIAGHPQATLAVVTGFFIPMGQPPCGETDGPLGAVYLARALHPLGIRVVIATDSFCARAIQTGLNVSGLRKDVPLVVLPSPDASSNMDASDYRQFIQSRTGPYTHLLAIERVGPSHTLDSVRNQEAAPAMIREFAATVPPDHHDRCHTMRGLDITGTMSPVHLLFEKVDPGVVTIGIGDGGNEIGMGRIPWDAIRRNIPGGGLVACRVATEQLIVCGISNWGAYGLAAGVRLLRRTPKESGLFSPEKEFEILEAMVKDGPLVDGISGLALPSVDGLDFNEYAGVLSKLSSIA
jgi:hypothetical protein